VFATWSSTSVKGPDADVGDGDGRRVQELVKKLLGYGRARPEELMLFVRT